MKLLTTLLLLLSFTFTLYGQSGTITGTVTDTEGKLLETVNVGLLDTQIGSTTNEQGEFIISTVPTGSYTLQASIVGFETVQREITITAGKTVNLSIQLSSDIEDLSEILVEGEQQSYRNNIASTAMKTPTSTMKAPQSISVVTKQVIDDQLNFTLDEVLENVSGIGTTDGFGGTIDGFNIRGFFSRDVFIDGLPETGANPIKMDVSTVERVDVLKGPASAVFGRTQPGGMVNIVTKEPLYKRRHNFEFTGGGRDQFTRGVFDVTGPLTENQSIRYRVIGMVERNESFRRFMDGNTFDIMPVFAFDLAEDLELSVDLQYQRDTTPIDRGIPAVDGEPGPVPRSFSMSGPQSSRTAEEWRGRYEFKYSPGENFSLYHRTRIATSDNEFLNVQPTGIQGNELTRSTNKNDNEEDTYLVQLEGIYQNSFLGTDHTILTGMEYRFDQFNFNFRFADTPNLNINNPDYTFNPVFPDEPSGGGRFPTRTYSIYWQDQIDVTEKWTFLVGGRFDWARVKSFFRFQDTFNEQITTSSEFTPRTGIVYRPVEAVSLFGNYAESFIPQNGRDAAGNSFDPQEGRQFESGVKIQMPDGRLQATLAYFNIEKRNIPVSDPTSQTGASILTGEQESEGFEMDLVGTPVRGLQFIANYSYIDADVSEDTNTDIVGNRLPNVARHRGRLWVSYLFSDGLLDNFKFGAGVTAVGKRFADLGETVELPDYGLVDASLTYRPPALDMLEATIQFENILDEEFYTSGVSFGANNIQVGNPRTVSATIRLNL